VKILKYENFENKFLGVSYDTKYFNKIIKEDKGTSKNPLKKIK